MEFNPSCQIQSKCIPDHNTFLKNNYRILICNLNHFAKICKAKMTFENNFKTEVCVEDFKLLNEFNITFLFNKIIL